MLIVTQIKRPGINIWPTIGVIKPRSWPKLGGTYGIRSFLYQNKYLCCFIKNCLPIAEKIEKRGVLLTEVTRCLGVL